MGKACIVALTYNSKNDLPEFFSSIKQLHNRSEIDIFMIDNASNDGTYEMLDRLSKHEGFTLISSGGNLGYTAGNNVFLNDKTRISKYDYIFISNVDLTLEPDAVEEGIKTLESDPKVGIVGSLERQYGTDDIRSFGAFWDYKKGAYGPLKYDGSTTARDVDWTNGAFIGLRREMVEKIGGFDDELWMYCDEMDYAARARNAGYRVVVNPKVVIHHKEKGRKSYFEIFYRTRNILFITNKHHPECVRKVHIKHIRDIFGNAFVHRDLKYGKHVLKGTFAYLRGRMGRVEWKE